MKRLSLILFLTFSASCFAQISHGGSPYSFNNNLSQPVPTFINQDTDVEALREEDAVTDQYKDISWRFGKLIPVNLNLNNSGVWETLSNGSRVWRLTIQSPGAVSLNLNYSAFNLPKNATFFIYNNKTTLGAFTESNNKEDGKFATTLLKGEQITLEYYEPSSEFGNGIIQISSIVHGYRDLFNQIEAFGSSGNCNVNTICDTTFWGNEIRSAVMQLHSNNQRFCSGALINNVLQDGTPYILTANHCSASTTDIFMFNYQSSDCSTNIDGPTIQTVVGCFMRANDSPSDFQLVELSSVPPTNYNVYYSGWSAVNVAPTSGTGIHHPRGDIKKISHDTDPLVEDGYYITGNDHWKVNDWNSGTTEPSSSGSPLFDQNHRIVGQLHGGDAACGNDAFDYYGKFAVSWATNSDTLKQLKHWLDPNNSGTIVLDGYDPNGAQYTTDAVLLNVEGIESYICGDSANPKITIRNNGNTTLTSLTINYEIDGTPFTPYNWTGNLVTYNIDTINLPTINFTSGNHNFTVYCSNPNGNTDQNLSNDTSTIDFIGNDQPLFATLNLTTDNFGAESSWLIRNAAGKTIIEGGGYPSVNGGQNFIENLCLYDGCFTFVFKDSYGDGFCCGTNGNGSLLLTEDATGDTLAIDSTFNSDSLSFFICMGNANGIEELKQNDFSVYPNPNNGSFNITSKEKITAITVFDILGKIIYQANNLNTKEKVIDLGNIDKGLYFAVVESNNQHLNTVKIMIE
jgi:hypothetical protein